MTDLKFIHSWEKAHRRGGILYVLLCMVFILIASVIGKAIGNYVSDGAILETFHVQDIYGLVFVCLIGILTGVYLWNHNETRYKELLKDNGS